MPGTICVGRPEKAGVISAVSAETEIWNASPPPTVLPLKFQLCAIEDCKKIRRTICVRPVPLTRTLPHAPWLVAHEALSFVLVLVMDSPETPNAALPDKEVMEGDPAGPTESRSNSAEKPLFAEPKLTAPPRPLKCRMGLVTGWLKLIVRSAICARAVGAIPAASNGNVAAVILTP